MKITKNRLTNLHTTAVQEDGFDHSYDIVVSVRTNTTMTTDIHLANEILAHQLDFYIDMCREELEA